MNPYETPPSAVALPKPDLLERATRLRGFCGKLAYLGLTLALVSFILGCAILLIFELPGFPGIAGVGVVLGGVTAVTAVAWAWVAILLESIAHAKNRNRAS